MNRSSISLIGKGTMKRDLQGLISILVLAIILAGCGGMQTPSPAPAPVLSETSQGTTPTSAASIPDSTATLDPCSTGEIEAEVQKVHRHMREFDDASILAANMPRENLGDSIAGLQRIRREAEDEEIPACLLDLKTHQVEHMNTVINTLVTFMGGADRASLEQAILIAREQHDQYTLELARLLGLTVVPATVPVLGTPEGTPAP